jgi:hypothetical protein
MKAVKVKILNEIINLDNVDLQATEEFPEAKSRLVFNNIAYPIGKLIIFVSVIAHGNFKI